MNGKGDSPRNCFSEDFRNNYDIIFKCKFPKVAKTTSSNVPASRSDYHTKTPADAPSQSKRRRSSARP